VIRIPISIEALDAFTRCGGKRIISTSVKKGGGMVEWSDLFDGYRIGCELREKFEDGSVLAIWTRPHEFPVDDSPFPFEAFVIDAIFYTDPLGDTGNAQEEFEIVPELQRSMTGRQLNSVSILVKRDGFRELENQTTITGPIFVIDIGIQLDTDKGPVELITYGSGVLDSWLGDRALTISSTGQSEASLPTPVN